MGALPLSLVLWTAVVSLADAQSAPLSVSTPGVNLAVGKACTVTWLTVRKIHTRIRRYALLRTLDAWSSRILGWT